MADLKFLDLTGLTEFKTKADALYAPLASPALTGTPTAPTATAGTNTTQIATTAFVNNAISGISSALVFKGSVETVANLPSLAGVSVGWTYNIATKGTSTADFVEGAGKVVDAGANVSCVEVDVSGTATKKWDILGGNFDISGLEAEVATKLTKVTAMPANPADGDYVLYLGTTTSDYTQGRIYQYNATGTEWVLVGNGMTAITTGEVDALFA